MDGPFYPALWARNTHFQTILGSQKIRMTGKNEMAETSEEVIVDVGKGVRLLGYHARPSDRKPRGLVILIHGWEGSADSAYILSTGRFLYRHGFEIFRLNLRDHGRSHHLNKGLFHGALTDETAEAVRKIADSSPDSPCFIIGFSLGGNFALRIALQHAVKPVRTLKTVFCISPALDPYKSTMAIDSGFAVYRMYFLNKWKRSLLEKQRCFPELYNFDAILHHNTCMGLTEAIMPWYSDFSDYHDYFRLYTLTGDVLAPISVPVIIFAASDDPVVDVEDFRRLPRNRCLDVSIERYGGHCGFLDPFHGCWYEKRIDDILTRKGY